jgi:hypothetical protein
VSYSRSAQHIKRSIERPGARRRSPSSHPSAASRSGRSRPQEAVVDFACCSWVLVGAIAGCSGVPRAVLAIRLGLFSRAGIEQLLLGGAGNDVEENRLASTGHQRFTRHRAFEQRDFGRSELEGVGGR